MKPSKNYLEIIGPGKINEFIEGLVQSERALIEERAAGKLPTPKRKVIHISTMVWNRLMFVLAVCNDGTIWQLVDQEKGRDEARWESYPTPPESI